MKKKINAGSFEAFKDLVKDTWYYYDMVEATKAYEYEKNNDIEIWK